MDKAWREWASKRGYRLAFGEPAVVDEVRAEIEGRKDTGELDETFYKTWLSSFRYLDGVELPAVKTVIMFAVPRPAHRLRFTSDDGPFEALVPPTYRWYTRLRERLQEELAANLLGDRHKLVPLPAPLKPMAARLGLVTYGRNNITYAPGFGSYHQLIGFLTDADLGPTGKPQGDAPAVLPDCQHCQACRQACPTGAIGEDRFLLHAERCLTLPSELPGPWPDWFPASRYHCLIGCLICQRVCPQNAGLLAFEEVEMPFTAEETARILSQDGDATDPLWEAIKAKLASAGFPEYEKILGRNLRTLRASGANRL